jgi:hypothetical protein
MLAGPSACRSGRRRIRQVVLPNSQAAHPEVGDFTFGCCDRLRIEIFNLYF